METSPGDITETRAYISDNREDGSTSTTSTNLTPYLQAGRQLSSGYVSIGSNNVKASTIANAGARATMEGVDSLDQDQINHVINGTGHYVSQESETIGLPILATGTPYTDADADNMWDVAEIAVWGNITTTNNPIADEDGDGYTDIEETFFYFTGRK